MSNSFISLSKESLKDLTGEICNSLLSNFSEEFQHREYLIERYKRSEEMAKLRNQDNDVNIDIICCYEKYITDLAAGYIMGKPLTYYNRNNTDLIKTNTIFGKEKSFLKKKTDSQISEEDDEFLNLYRAIAKANGDTQECFELAQRTFVERYVYEYVYTNEKGEIRYKPLKGDCIAIKSNDVEEKIIGFIRRYTIEKGIEDGKYSQATETIIELFTPYERVYFSDQDGYQKKNNLMREGTKPFDEEMEIPIVEYSMCEGIALFEQQISQIRGYELVTNNTKKVLNYNDAAILMIKGAMFLDGASEDEVDAIIERYKTKGILFIGDEIDGGGAEWLKKEINDGASENHKKNLKNDIFSIAGLFNPENDNQVYQNTLSLMFKLYGLETKMSEFIEMFKASISRRIKIISEIINKKEGTDYQWQNIEIETYRNLPSNTQEEMNLLNQLWGKLPIKKLYDMMSFVEDSEKMVEEYEEYRIWEAKLEAKVAKIMAEATEEDVQPNAIEDYNEEVTDDNQEVDMSEEETNEQQLSEEEQEKGNEDIEEDTETR